MTKKEFLKRMEMAYDMGLCTDEVLSLAERWIDAVMRFEGGQIHYFVDFLESEKERTSLFASFRTLANDETGYKIVHLMAILTHPCQKCATDREAWHTRLAFCPHQVEKKLYE